MLTIQELNPIIKKIIESCTEGYSLMETARLRSEILTQLERESLCGIIRADQVAGIIAGVLTKDMERITARLKELNHDPEAEGRNEQGVDGA